MSYRLIDYPHFVDISFYQQALDAMTERLKQTNEVVSVFQLGSVSATGISDLDMLAVFNDQVKIEKNFLTGLSPEERYLFIHNLYGISKNNFEENRQFDFFHNYKLLHGEKLPEQKKATVHQDVLQRQVALEYVTKMYITIQLQEDYGVLRMRDLLLHVKALKYDLEFLGSNFGKLHDLVEQIFEWRKNWFSEMPSNNEIIKWWNSFRNSFDEFITVIFKTHKMYLPLKTTYKIAKNISIIPSEEKIAYTREGLKLPRWTSMIGKKYFRIQNRLSHFRFQIPIENDTTPPILMKKQEFEKKIIAYNKSYLPSFLPLSSSLHAI
ncbi:hypothetical protein BH11BAC1_BH11BAC1_11910 [soil metagenome]